MGILILIYLFIMFVYKNSITKRVGLCTPSATIVHAIISLILYNLYGKIFSNQ